MRRGLLAVCAVLALAALTLAQPSSAFNYGKSGGRAVGSNVVADASAYVAISGTTCTVNHLTGGSCSVTITNKAVKSLVFTASETNDPSSRATSPSVSPSTAIAPGSTASVSTTISSCIGCLAGQTYTVTWSVTAAKTHELDATKTGLNLVITWS